MGPMRTLPPSQEMKKGCPHVKPGPITSSTLAARDRA